MDRRTLLFISISVLIIVLYQEVILKRLPQPPLPPPPVETVSPARTEPTPVTTGAGEKTTALLESSTAEATSLEGREITVDTDLYTAVLNTVGGRIQSFTLKHFRERNEPDSPPLELIVEGTDLERPMGVELRGAQVWSDARVVYQTNADNLSLSGSDEKTLELRAEVAGQPLVKRVTFRGNSYPIALAVETPPPSALPKELSSAGADGLPPGVALVWARAVHHAARGVFEGAVAFINAKLVQTSIEKLQKPDTLTGTVTWAGFEDHYFLSAVAPERASAVLLWPRGTNIETKILTPYEGSDPTKVSYTLFLGPKALDILEAADHDFARAMNLGWFGPISLLLLRVLNLSHRVTGNYGIDIILLTCLVKIAFWPLTQKSFQSMREMQKVQPEMARIREKYKDDAKKMNAEIMELYKRHKVNPLGGCLPMVLQIPVFFGLYQLLANTIQLRHAPFMLWITDLSAPERLDIFGYGVPVLTLLLGVSMFVQQRMTPPAGDPNQQKIMMFMPILFTFMFIGFPAGLTLYWLTNNVLTIAQQYFVIRKAQSPAAVPSRASSA